MAGISRDFKINITKYLTLLLTDQRCRELVFKPEQTFNEKRLLNHVVNIAEVVDEDSCGYLCFMEPNCASYNFEISTSQAGVHKCELNNSTHESNEDNLVNDQNFVYRGTKVSLGQGVGRWGGGGMYSQVLKGQLEKRF